MAVDTALSVPDTCHNRIYVTCIKIELLVARRIACDRYEPIFAHKDSLA